MFTVTSNLTEMELLLKALGRTNDQIYTIMSSTLQRYLNKAERDVKKQLSGPKLSVRTGRLRGSISNRVEIGVTSEGKITLQGVLGVLAPKDARVLEYANAQEEGATVWPRNGSLLVIPLKAAKAQDRDKGATRFTPAEARQKYRYTFWKVTKNANLILFGVLPGPRLKGKYGNLVPLFLGKRRVKIAGGTGEGVRFLQQGILDIVEPFQNDIAKQISAILTKKDKQLG